MLCSWALFGRVPLFFFVVSLVFFFLFDFLIFKFFPGRIFRRLPHHFCVWSFSPLRFIPAQTMREKGRRRSALQDSLFSAAGRKKKRKEKLSSQQQHLGAAFFTAAPLASNLSK
jgi:uncharacterized protein (DUF58 family)